MITKVIDVKTEYEEGLREGAEILRSGEVVAFPTETVYGLGANALDALAVLKIFAAKGRPADNPLIVHVCDMDMLEGVVRECNEKTRALLRKFWPGPLTVVLPRAAAIPDEVTAGLDTVAVRMPGNSFARDLIAAAKVPVAAPSANLSGRPSPTHAEHVLRDMRGRIPLILDGGPCEVGVESTVLDMSGEVPELLRPGGVPLEALREALGEVRTATGENGEKPKSPGMKYQHYSPKAEVVVVRGANARSAICHAYDEAEKSGKRSVILAQEASPEYGGRHIFTLGEGEADVAHNFFDALRTLDDEGFSLILMEAVDEEGLGRAVMDRAVRAAGFNIIDT